jgi:hypothetical protein
MRCALQAADLASLRKSARRFLLSLRDVAEEDSTMFSDIRPIFIVGAGRSGTTLLQLMLNAHPRISVAGEIHFFDLILQIRNRVPSLAAEEDFERFCSLVKQTYNFRHLAHGQEALARVERRLRSTEGRTYELVYRCLLEEFAAMEGAVRCGEKTPQNVRYIPEILRIFPQAKIVHMIRDPRDVVSSLVRMPWASPDVITNALKWKADVHSTVNLCGCRSTYRELRYEDLVASPESCLRSLCSFIEEPFSPEMLNYHETAGRHIVGEPWKEGTRRELYRRAVERWRDDLAEPQVAIVQWICGSELGRFGYRPRSIGLSGRILSPCVAARELWRYMRYRIQETRRRRAEGDVIRGTVGQAVRALLRGLGFRSDREESRVG